MGWIFEKIVEIVGQIIAFLLSFLAVSVCDVYQLKGSDTLDYFFEVFGGTSGGDAGLFGQAYRLFLIVGLGIIFLGMLYNLFKAFFGPIATAEAPTRTVLKAIVFACLVGFSQNIVALIIDIAQIPYDAITNNITAGNIALMIGERIIGVLDNVISGMAGGTAESLLEYLAGTAIFDVKIFTSIIAILLFMMLFKNMLMLVLEMAERYLMIGLLTIFAPLCIACGAVKAVEDVFKNWLSWMFNACVVLVLNTFFLTVFIFGFQSKAEIPYLCLWIAWLKAGQKIDEHMNALGLKTAKTGGFGQDVMSAMIAGLPMALGAADKVTGTRLASLNNWARGGFQGKPSQSGFGIMAHDPRKGEHYKTPLTSMLGGIASKTPEGKKAVDNLSNKIHKGQTAAYSMAGKAANTVKEKFPGGGTGHGSRSGISHSALNDMLTGKAAMPAKGTDAYNNVMKDMLDMKAGTDKSGKSLSKELEDKGYKVTSMQSDKDGSTTFTAQDKNGNVVTGKITDGEPEKNSGLIAMEGEDGQKRSMSISSMDAEGRENPINIGGMEDKPSDDRTVAAGTEAEGAMEQNGKVEGGQLDNSQTLDGKDSSEFNNVATADGDNGGEVASSEGGDQVKVGDETYNLGEPDENGIITGINEKNPNDTKQFTQNANGTYQEVQGESVGEASNSTTFSSDGKEFTATGAPDSNGNIEATDKDGNKETFHDNGDGTFSKIGDAASNVESGQERSFSANGQNFTTTAEAGKEGLIEAKNAETGETQQFMQDSSGNIYAANKTSDASGANGGFEKGSKVADAASVTSNGEVPTSATIGGQTYDLKKNADGTFTGTAADGSTATFASDGKGGLNQLGAATQGTTQSSVRDNAGNNFTLTKNSDGSFTGVDSSTGTTATFTQGSNGQLYKTSETKSIPNGSVSMSADGTTPVSASVSGSDYKLTKNADNTYTGTTASGQTATFSMGKDNQLQMTSSTMSAVSGSAPTQASGTFAKTATDSNGTSYNLTSKGNGQYFGTSTDGAGRTANFETKDGNLVKTSETRQYDTNKGFHNESMPLNDATMSSWKTDSATGTQVPQSLSFGRGADGQYQNTYDNFKDIGNGQYLGTNTKDGSTARFSVSSDGNNISMEQTFAYDARSGQKFQVSDSVVGSNTSGGTVQVQNSSGDISRMASDAISRDSGVTVRAADTGEYVRTRDSNLYDEYGRLSSNGGYMMTDNPQGGVSFIPVQKNQNGSVPTYDMKPEARTPQWEIPGQSGTYASTSQMMDSSSPSYNEKFADSVTQSYAVANSNVASEAGTHVMSRRGDIYNIAEGESACRTGDNQFLAQRYIRGAGDSDGNNEYKLDMSRCTFTSDGRLAEGTPIYIQGSNGQSVEMSLDQLYRGGSGDNNRMPIEYVHAVNPSNNQMSSMDIQGMHECQVTRQYVNGVPTDLDFSKATKQDASVLGYPNTCSVYTFENGDQVLAMPYTANTNDFQGVYAKLPFGDPNSSGSNAQEVYLSALPQTRINHSLQSAFGSQGYDRNQISTLRNTPLEVDTSSAEWKVVAAEYNIPSNARNAAISCDANNNPIITYSTEVAGKLNHYMVSGTNRNGAEAITQPGSNVPCAYRMPFRPDSENRVNTRKRNRNVMKWWHQKNPLQD